MTIFKLLSNEPWAITPQGLDEINALLTSLPLSGEVQTAATAAKPTSAKSTSLSGGGDGAYRLAGRVAVIDVHGVIHRRAGSAWCASWDGQDAIRQRLDHAMADPEVGAVLLSFDSPGGIAAGTKELADHIAGQTAKPVYAYADGLCASAAFWLASSTGNLYAPATATIGSIGVLQVHCDRSVANAQKGVHFTYITGGRLKAAGHGDAPLTGADQAYMQGLVDELHALFRADVSARSSVEANHPELWGDGQVFLGAEALALGLISGIVESEAALIAQINKELIMDKQTLADSHPALLAQIEAAAKESGAAEAKAAAESTLTAALADQLTLVEMVAGAQIATRVKTLAASGVTGEQAKALAEAGLLPVATAETPAQTAPDQEATSRAEILAALQNQTPTPLATGAPVGATNEASEIAAAVERISKIGA